MSDVVLTPKQKGVELRLEVRALAPTVPADLVFVAVNHTRIGVLCSSENAQRQGVASKTSVLVEERHPFAHRPVDQAPHGGRDVGIGVDLDDLDPLVACGVLGHHPSDTGRGGGIEGDEELPVAIQLLGTQNQPTL